MMHGPQRDVFDLSFSVPSVCADRLRRGEADIGLVPCAELRRLGLEFMPEVGIGCRGPVRSILLASKVPPGDIRTLAADVSSRTSVMLTRIVLERKYGCQPQIVTAAPDLSSMLEQADAALIIGDPALAIELDSLPSTTLDLGAEWVDLTGLPMVFAVWAGKPGVLTEEARAALVESRRYAASRMDEVIAEGARTHNVPLELARRYLTSHIHFDLEEKDLQGLQQFLDWSEELDRRNP